jgi:hypothetical protein
VQLTRRTIFTIGVLLILAGFFILNQGSQVLLPLAEVSGLGSHVQTETTYMAPTLLPIAAANYSFLSADLKANVQAQGSLQVGDGREVAFYVMDEGNFSRWRLGYNSTVILTKPTAISYNFTFTPKVAGEYYFVFDNQDTSRRVVVFNLNLISDRVVLSPVLEYAGYELSALGILLGGLGLKFGKTRKHETPSVAGWECKFCEAKNTGEKTFCSKCGKSQT